MYRVADIAWPKIGRLENVAERRARALTRLGSIVLRPRVSEAERITSRVETAVDLAAAEWCSLFDVWNEAGDEFAFVDGFAALFFPPGVALRRSRRILPRPRLKFLSWDKSGVAPLHRAVGTRCAPAVRALLVNGADAMRKNRSGSTPLDLAMHNSGRGDRGSAASREQQAQINRVHHEYGVTM